MNAGIKMVMPAEWRTHSRTWMLWPLRSDNWKHNAVPAQRAFANVARAISSFEDVYIGIQRDSMDGALKLVLDMDKEMRNDPKLATFEELLERRKVNFVPMSYNDSWMRDVGPTFLVSADAYHNASVSSKICGMDWKFNAWGEIYDDWTLDDSVASQVMKYLTDATVTESGVEFSMVRLDDFILEGGSIHVDGEGTILVTEECLLNKNRNKHLTKAQIEANLLKYLWNGDVDGKVIWLPNGLVADEDTNGHIDNFCCFSNPGQVVLAWTDDENDKEQYDISRTAYEILSNSTDAKGRKLEVVKLPLPKPMYFKKEDVSSLTCDDAGNYARIEGERMAGSYVNYYIANGGIICPQFHQPESDKKAVEVLQSVYPSYTIVPVYTYDVLLGGGNIHCITQQQPL